MKPLQVLFLFALLALTILACCPTKTRILWDSPKSKVASDQRYKGFLIRFTPGTPMEQIESFETRVVEKFGLTQPLAKQFCPCDPALRYYPDLDIDAVIKSGDPEVDLRKGGGGAGDTIRLANVLNFSPGYVLQLDSTYDSKYIDTLTRFEALASTFPQPRALTPGETPLRVAIFDTGFDTTVGIARVSYPTSDPTTPCPAHNFTGDKAIGAALNDEPYDDDPAHHGTKVTTMLMSQLGDAPVEIMPIKVLKANGSGNLLDFLCGLASFDSTRRRVDVINISMGFYSLLDPAAEKLVTAYLRQTGARIFAAAGNRNANVDGWERMEGTSSTDLRNLDVRKYRFYPASYSSASLPQLLSVTTAVLTPTDNYDKCPTQNFSGTLVDVAVLSNSNDECGLMVGPSGTGPTRSLRCGGKGSSFATPILAGQVVRHWITHRGSLPGGKDALLNWAGIPEMLPTTESFIRTRRVAKVVSP